VSPTYVYGLVRADLAVPAGLDGLDGAPVELVAHEGLGALVSAAPTGRPLGTREDLFAHERVVDAVAAEVTVLPMRFGSVIERPAVVDELLAPHLAELDAAIADLDGHVQYSVKGRYEREVVLREVVVADPEIAELRERVHGVPEEASYEDRMRLGELVVGAIEERARRDGGRMHEMLSAQAAASVARPPAFIVLEHGRRARIRRRSQNLRQQRRIAQAKVETLTRHRMERLRRVAHQHGAGAHHAGRSIRPSRP